MTGACRCSASRVSRKWCLTRSTRATSEPCRTDHALSCIARQASPWAGIGVLCRSKERDCVRSRHSTTMPPRTPRPVVLTMKSMGSTTGLGPGAGVVVLCRFPVTALATKSGVFRAQDQSTTGLRRPAEALTRPPSLLPLNPAAADRSYGRHESARGPRVDRRHPTELNKNKTESHSCDIVPGRDSVVRLRSPVAAPAAGGADRCRARRLRWRRYRRRERSRRMAGWWWSPRRTSGAASPPAGRRARWRCRASSSTRTPIRTPTSRPPSDGVALAKSQMAIVNGIGYDTWASKLLAANPSSARDGARRRRSARARGGRQPAPVVLAGVASSG